MLESLGISTVLTTQKSESAGNQQGTDVRAAWLAGILDAEGSIGLYKNGNGAYYARVTITNTDRLMKHAIEEILEDHGIAVYIQDNQRQKNKNWKPRWQMIFTGAAKPKGLLDLVLPYLVTKRREAELALEFIESRSSKRYLNREGSRWTRDPLTEREQFIVEEVKRLKNVRHLRDHTRSAKSEDMVRPARRRAEAGRDDQPRPLGE